MNEPDGTGPSTASASDAGVSRRWARSSYEVEDARWATRAQLGDWLVLLVLMVAFLGVHVFVFLTEPGIRDFGG